MINFGAPPGGKSWRILLTKGAWEISHQEEIHRYEQDKVVSLMHQQKMY